MPFDVADWRAIQYDLKPKSVATRLFAQPIREHLRAIEKDGWKAPAPPITSPSTVSAEFVDTSAEYGTSGKWLKLLEDTNSCLDLMGVTLSAWRRTPGFSDHVRAKAKAGCRVRILIAHPDNPVLPFLINPLISGAEGAGFRSLDTILGDINESSAFYTGLQRDIENIQVRRVIKGNMHLFLTRTDQQALFIQYLSHESWGNGPLWKVDSSSVLYTTMTKEFEFLWKLNADAELV